ncbi:MAG TPA: hypothetical protein VFY33_05940 [Solirubrobacterales bacterium]|nr:hypothetical protein [Solirubrobacterales bacterium]
MAIIVAAFAIALVGCGGDDDDNGTSAATTTGATAAEAEALQDEIADLSDEEQIERVGEAWAEPFAAGDEAMCIYLHPDLGASGRETCTSYAEGALTRSSILQASFAGTTVERVAVKGQTAVATFSNGEPVEFQQDPAGKWWVVDPSGG